MMLRQHLWTSLALAILVLLQGLMPPIGRGIVPLEFGGRVDLQSSQSVKELSLLRLSSTTDHFAFPASTDCLNVGSCLNARRFGGPEGNSEARDRVTLQDRQAAAAPDPPLSMEQIKEFIQVPTPDSAIAIEIRNRFISFPLDNQVIDDLRRYGAGRETLQILTEFVASAKAPSATLESPPEVMQGETLMLFAIASPDPENGELYYSWDGPPGAIVSHGQFAEFKTSCLKLRSNPLEVTVTLTVNNHKGGFVKVRKTVRVRVPEIEATPVISVVTRRDGKDTIVELSHTLSRTALSKGFLDVDMNPSGDARSVSGSFPSRPCTIELDEREKQNAARIVLEAPRASNDSELLVVHVRPGDPKRPVHFRILWQIDQM